MKKVYLLGIVSFFSLLTYVSFAQTYVYTFNNSFAEQGSGGPDLTEYFTNGASAGSFSSQTITTSSGTCGTQNVFNFNAGGGVFFDNSSNFIGSSYTINMLFKFNQTPGGLNISGNGYQRVIIFDTLADQGIYSRDPSSGTACIQSHNGLGSGTEPIVGTCPNQTEGQFVFFTLVRDGSVDSAFIYIDGTLFQRIYDPGQLYVPPTTAPSSILFFIDQQGDIEEGDGSIRYLSLSPNISTDVQIQNSWNNLCTTVLPLHLLEFSANKQSSSVLLNWKTVNEVNTSYFEIERSSSGNNFIKIGNVQAANTLSSNNYSYIDALPLQTNFYRLRMVDKDGRFTYSSTLKVNFSGSQKLEVYPNPAKDVITISGIKENEMVKLLNIEGKILLQKRASGQSMTIDINNFSSGLYILQYFDGETMQNKKFLKE